MCASYSRRGSAAYPPELMLAIVLVEKHEGHCSPSQWHRHQSDPVSLFWIGEEICPARNVWYEFREQIVPVLDQWFLQLLQLAQQTGITTATKGVIDGTLIAASASRHRLLNEKQLDSRLHQLGEAIDLDQRQQPLGRRPGWMAETPPGREIQNTRCLRAKELLKPRLETNAKKCPSERLVVERVVISVSDPEAALAPDKFKVFRPLHNSLLIADRESPLILGYEIFGWGQDTNLLMPTIERTEQLTGRRLEQVIGDTGFITGQILHQCEVRFMELIGPWKMNDFSKSTPAKFYSKDLFFWHPDDYEYECPVHQRLRFRSTETRCRADGHKERNERFKADPSICAASPCRAGCTPGKEGREMRRSEYEDEIRTHRAKMETPDAKAISKTRGQIVERRFADLKEHCGLRRHTGQDLSV